MKVRVSEDFRVAYKRLKKKYKSLEGDFERLLVSLLKNPLQGVELEGGARRSAWQSVRKVVARVEGHE